MSVLWRVGGEVLDLTERTLIMGIVNLTPDSFSDGGVHNNVQGGVAHGLRLLSEGADILDLGGESTRPGSEAVDVEEEIRRVLPVLERIHAENPAARLSIDTQKAAVGRAALAAGARILNDVSGGRDPEMFPLAAESGAGLVIMHMRGTPKEMQAHPRYEDVVGEVSEFFRERLAAASSMGVAPEQIIFDPGIGFGKTLEHNLALIGAIPELEAATGRPLLLGVSRKRWLGEITGRAVEDRLAASLGGLAACVTRGAKILRVHDVLCSCDVVRILDRVKPYPFSPC